MRSPVSIYLIVAALLVYSAMTALQAILQGTAWFLVWTVPAVVCALGLLFQRRWSLFVLYLLNVCLVAGWSVYAFGVWKYIDEIGVAKLAALGVALSAFGIWSSLAASRFLRVTGDSQLLEVAPEKL